MKPVTIHGADWCYSDIAEEVEWCRSRSWVRATYDSVTDHSHCQICWWKLYRSDNVKIGEGYRSAGKVDLWLCAECHEQFIAN